MEQPRGERVCIYAASCLEEILFILDETIKTLKGADL